MSAGERAQRCRESAGLFRLGVRGGVVVEGGDRVRWLNGMLSNDVAKLAVGRERSGCYALLLTRIGRIVTDVHVLARGEAFWLECDAEAVSPLLATLAKFVIADDVRLSDLVAESFLVVQLVVELQDALGVRVGAEELRGVQTVGELVGVFERAPEAAAPRRHP